MKLVELLARELKKWPIGTVSMTQDDDGAVNMYDHAFPTTLDTKCTWRCIGFTEYLTRLKEVASDQQTAIVTIAQWQAERDRQKGGEWKRHRGGKQPVADAVRVEFKFRSGVTGECYADNLLWDHQRQDDDVMQYRIISQPQAEEVEVNVFVGKDVHIEYAFSQDGVALENLDWKPLGNAKMGDIEFDSVKAEEAPMIANGDTRGHKGPFPCAPEGEPLNQLGWDIQFPSGVCSVQAKTEQIETPFKWRDEVTELNAYIEKYTRERDALIERLASEGFALIPPVVSVVSEFSGADMSDWRNWQAGDIVECVTGGYTGVYTKGNQYKVEWVKEDCFSVYDDCGEKSSCDWFDYDAEGLKFIRRP